MNKSHFSGKKKVWLAIIAGIIVVATGWWAWGEFVPRPLGDKLEYIGKRDYGNWLGFDYRPSSVYYYGTDMSVKEATLYFTKTSIFEKPHGTENWQSFGLKTFDGEVIYFHFYPREAFLKKYPDSSFKVKNDYVISIPGSKYDAAKDSL